MNNRLHLSKYLLKLVSLPTPLDFFVEHGKNPSQVLHIGAHLAEEKSRYEQLGIKNSLWVEAQPQVFRQLVEIVGPINSLNCAVWSSQTTLKLKVSSNSVSSSLLDLDSDNPWVDLKFDEEIEVNTLTMDDVLDIFERREVLSPEMFLVLDIQGAEYQALSRWEKRSKIIAISCEVSKYRGYSGASRRWQISLKMLRLGFVPGAAFLDSKTGHGDQLYVKFGTAVSNPKLLALSFVRLMLLKLIELKNFLTPKFFID